MEQDGHLKSLAERIRDKAEQERMRTENVFKEQLRTLSDSLRESSTNALHTMSDAITADIETATASLSQHYRTLSKAYGRAWVRTAITAFAMMLGLTAGGWVLMKGAAYWLDTHRQELAQVKADLRVHRQALATMKPERARAETWGLSFHEDKNGQFIIIPVGMKINTTWTRGENQTIKLEK